MPVSKVQDAFLHVFGGQERQQQRKRDHFKSIIGPHGPTPNTEVTIIQFPEDAFHSHVPAYKAPVIIQNHRVNGFVPIDLRKANWSFKDIEELVDARSKRFHSRSKY